MGAIKDYLKGQTTKGTCSTCGHGAAAVPGCGCAASWCPCHRGAYGHGGHGCDNRHNTERNR
ncbi:hypothetical protein [Couchioplanes caeruleus]|uniref:Uncharacterized protein n=2 Tax=Couchioplanes caeruleus TaxID=56438 RepID=A0A1K0GG14_9ACTN|nr:hypothetical protein [Couchioplanes caeruleus]OJF09788.1 hypothetical protein BG844_35540 [Couchioplanes caeruleus subsp. caeruleus]ROP31436.1 hypothetical protein EDD30_4337 [Couchioplanes caeruleus]